MASRTSTDPIEILLEMGVDLDNLSEEEDYLSALMEAVNTLIIKNASDPRISPLQQEIVKVRKKRKAADTKFKARKTTVSKSKLLGTSAIVPKKTQIKKEQLLALPAAAEEKEDKKKKPKEKNLLKEIAQSVTNIADILKKQYKLKEKSTEQDRKRAEQQKRKLQEAGLEKRFQGILKTAEKIVAPVRSIFDRILQFLTNILLGKFLVKLVEWISDPDNRSKITSIIRFLTDNWPKLLSAYIIFGTGLGKFSRFLVKVLARGAVRLAAATAGLLARLFGGRALGRFSRFLGKRGKLIAGGVEAVTTIFAFKALEDAFTKNLGPEESASIDNDIPVSGYQGGGLVQPIFKFEGGGSVGFNLLNPFTWFSGKGQQAVDSKKTGAYSDDTLSGRLLNRRNATNEAIRKMRGYEEGGEVDGPSGIDKVPAMLTDGEFVMSRGAVQKYGLSQLEAMNAAGGGTNKPKMMNGTVFAAGGGHVGDREKAPDKMLTPVEKIAPSISSSTIKPSFVLALKDGIQGKLDKLTGKFTPKAFTEAERARYTQFGGKIPEKPKKPERSDFPMGRSGAKKYQEAKKSFEAAAATSKVTPVATPKVTPKATTKTLTKEQLLGKSGIMPTTDQLSATATKRHAELMKSTDQKKIADYDAKHGTGAYSKKLQEKLNKMYSPEKAKQMTTGKVKPTGKVVGRENLSPQAQAAIARLEAKKGLPPDMQYTRNGKKISAEEFNRIPEMGRLVMGLGPLPSLEGLPGMGGGGGGTNALTNQAKVRSIPGMLGSLFDGFRKKKIDPQTILEDAKSKSMSMAKSMGGTVRDGNKGIMTPELQKEFDKLNANRARADKLEAYNKMMSTQGGLRKNLEKDPLFAEYEKIQDDINHPLHDKVSGDLFADDKPGMRFAEFKKFKAQQSQAKLSPNQPQPKVSAPQPPTPPSNNVQVIKSPRGSQTRAAEGNTGSNVPAIDAGNGNKSKWKIFGMSLPF